MMQVLVLQIFANLSSFQRKNSLTFFHFLTLKNLYVPNFLRPEVRALDVLSFISITREQSLIQN